MQICTEKMKKVLTYDKLFSIVRSRMMFISFLYFSISLKISMMTVTIRNKPKSLMASSIFSDFHMKNGTLERTILRLSQSRYSGSRRWD